MKLRSRRRYGELVVTHLERGSSTMTKRHFGGETGRYSLISPSAMCLESERVNQAFVWRPLCNFMIEPWEIGVQSHRIIIHLVTKIKAWRRISKIRGRSTNLAAYVARWAKSRIWRQILILRQENISPRQKRIWAYQLILVLSAYWNQHVELYQQV